MVGKIPVHVCTGPKVAGGSLASLLLINYVLLSVTNAVWERGLKIK